MNIKGTIKQKLEVLTGTSTKGNWQTQGFIIETIESYPKMVCIDAFQKVSEELNKYEVGDIVDVSVNIESREYNSRWYTDVKAWKIVKEGTTPGPVDAAVTKGDDLPF
tara:strand:+ start:23971 stop:24294 length:324 start_codon:yes stop_codon:yes gene_type:complete